MISWHNVGQMSPAAVDVICHSDISVGANKERRRVGNCVRRSGSAAASRLDEKAERPACLLWLSNTAGARGQGANGGGEGGGWMSTTQLASTRGQNVQILGEKKQKKHVLPFLFFQLCIISNLMLV